MTDTDSDDAWLSELLQLTVDALDARDKANDGRFCECDDPDVMQPSLMCKRCRLINQERERAEVLTIVSAHDFVSAPPHPFARLADVFCRVCMNTRDHERHHGVPAVGTTRWGERVVGVGAG